MMDGETFPLRVDIGWSHPVLSDRTGVVQESLIFRELKIGMKAGPRWEVIAIAAFWMNLLSVQQLHQNSELLNGDMMRWIFDP